MIPKVERLVNLTIALLESPRPVTFAELRRRTPLYRQAAHDAARRMFERDKADLRHLGVPIETVPVAFGEEEGYQVRRRAYELPDVDLTAEEVAALALAVDLAGAEDRLALARLAARAPDPAALDGDPGARVRVGAGEVDAVAEAVVARAPIRFHYQPVDGEPGERTVDAYAVVHRRGAWYLVGRDHRRDALRAFRLDRIVGAPTIAGPPGVGEPPPDLDLAAAVSGPEVAEVDALVAVAPDTRWVVELHGGVDTARTHAGWPVLRIAGLDPLRDRSWLLGLCQAVVVLEPPALREDVSSALARLAGEAGP